MGRARITSACACLVFIILIQQQCALVDAWYVVFFLFCLVLILPFIDDVRACVRAYVRACVRA